jgi:hypothetical protein
MEGKKLYERYTLRSINTCYPSLFDEKEKEAKAKKKKKKSENE